MKVNKSNKISESVIGESWSLLSAREKRIGIVVVLVNIFLGLLDLIGVLAIGLVGSLAVVGVTSSQPSSSLNVVLEFLRLDSLNFQSQVSILALTACVVFLIRTFASVYLSRRILHFLSRKGARLASDLFNKVLKLPIDKIQSRSIGELSYVLIDGVTAITLGIIGLSLSFLSDLVLLVVLTTGLFLINPSIAITSIISFGMTGAALYWLTRLRAKKIGEQNSKFSVKIYSEVNWVITNYRELFVKSRLGFHKSEIDHVRSQLAGTLAEQQFLPNISKYIIEASLIVISLFVSAIQFLLGDAAHAVSALSVFMAAGSRLAPTVMRMQQNAIQIKTNSGIAKSALLLISEVRLQSDTNLESPEPDFEYSGFRGEIVVENCSYQYSKNSTFSLKKVDFHIKEGEQVAIVGPSGGGKSTLIDLILGILEPSEGSVSLSGISPSQAIRKWPGVIGYVPQEVQLTSGSIEDNITRGFRDTQLNYSYIQELIQITQLSELQKDLESKDEVIREMGSNLSGGQKQRIGIARSLFTKPKLLVLDEATSALDSQTEIAVTNIIHSLKGRVTVLMVAHRLSTVRNADKVIYIDKGQILAVGTIDQVRAVVPNFDIQAELMGL